MDDDLDLRTFANRCRLFPLPNVVMFPHAILPLHIFEPRYREMTEDALSSDNLLAVVQLRLPEVPIPDTESSAPPIEKVACLGRIIQHERLPDGRFNLLLLGRRRVRLTRETRSGRLYRTAEAEIIEDIVDDSIVVEPVRLELVELFRRIFERHHEIDPYLAAVLETPQPLGILSDLLAHALGLPPDVKQRLLAEPRVVHRVEVLRTILRRAAQLEVERPEGVRLFPPPFSTN